MLLFKPIVPSMRFSTGQPDSFFQQGVFSAEAQKNQMFANKHKYEAEVKSVLNKMDRVIQMVQRESPDDARISRLRSELEHLQT